MTDLEYARTKLPIIVEFPLTADDTWVRQIARGAPRAMVPTQRVVVEGLEEADRVARGVLNLKLQRGKPCGGATIRRRDL